MPGSTYPAQNTATYFISQMEFADAINPEQMEEWNQALAPAGERPEEEGEKKPIGILELLGVSVGCIIMSHGDFCIYITVTGLYDANQNSG